MRGKFQEAGSTLKSESEAPQAELLLEQARVAGFSGDWRECKRLAHKAIELGTATDPTLMTLRQVKSLALYELGEFHVALEEIEEILALSELYPAGRTRFYALILQAKCLAMHSPESIHHSRALIDRVAADISEPDLDHALTLVRAEADLLRMEGLPYEKYSAAAAAFASAMGDLFYECLAYVDLEFSPIEEISKTYRGLLEALATSYSRISMLRSRTLPSTSAKILETGRKRQTHNNSTPAILSIPKFEQAVLLRYGIIVDLKNNKARRETLAGQSAKVLEALAQAPLDKEAIERLFPKS